MFHLTPHTSTTLSSKDTSFLDIIPYSREQYLAFALKVSIYLVDNLESLPQAQLLYLSISVSSVRSVYSSLALIALVKSLLPLSAYLTSPTPLIHVLTTPTPRSSDSKTTD